MVEELSPGETVIRDSGRWPISYAKSLIVTVNGRLYLTNRRLIFAPGGVFPSLIPRRRIITLSGRKERREGT